MASFASGKEMRLKLSDRFHKRLKDEADASGRHMTDLAMDWIDQTLTIREGMRLASPMALSSAIADVTTGNESEESKPTKLYRGPINLSRTRANLSRPPLAR